jgi:hypothetical protein
MGGNNFSEEELAARAKLRVDTGAPVFAYDLAMKKAPPSARTVCPRLDPKLPNKAGVVIRESRDSDNHPESRAIVVILDVTGSMAEVPRAIQKSLMDLMRLIISDSGVRDPHILIGAIGDANCDTFPLQLGQFEAGVEIEDDLTNLVLEEGGGGQDMETYELALWFLAEKTSIDCWEKRRKKGFVFIIGDENPYPEVDKHQVLALIGAHLERSPRTLDVVRKLQERYEVFYIMPKMTGHYGSPKIVDTWKALLGEHVLMLDKPEGISGLIATTINLFENDDIVAAANALRTAGTSGPVVESIERALSVVAKSHTKHGLELEVAGSGAGTGVATL